MERRVKGVDDLGADEGGRDGSARFPCWSRVIDGEGGEREGAAESRSMLSGRGKEDGNGRVGVQRERAW